MALTAEQLAAREGKLTASRVACLMRGDKAEIMELWREMVGHHDFVPSDFSDSWLGQLGSATEALNLDWYQKTRNVVLRDRGLVVVHPDYHWAACTLDAYDDALGGPVETKHCGGFERIPTLVSRYMPQLHWQMECTVSRRAALSIIQGNQEPNVEIVEYDKAYADIMMVRAHKFMVHVWNMTEPVEIDTPVAPPKATQEYNMLGNNSWANAAMDYVGNKKAAKLFEDSKVTLKGLMPHDARRAVGYGVSVTRGKSGRISVTEHSSDDAE